MPLLPLSRAMTRRQLQAYTLIVNEGLPHKELAVRLGCSVNTVRQLVQKIYRHTGADSTPQLIAWHWTKERK